MTAPLHLLSGKTTDQPLWAELEAALASVGIEMTGQEKLRRYLEQHPDMCKVTERIGKVVRNEFGPQAFLTLSVYDDPEINDQFLSLRVRMSEYGSDFLPRLRSVADPFDDELCASSGSILVTTDFSPIR